MSDVLDRVVVCREDAHDAARMAYLLAQLAIENGRMARITAREYEEDRSLKQNRYYWGVVLPEISEQARSEGQRYTVDAWHELFKRQFLGYSVERYRVAGRSGCSTGACSGRRPSSRSRHSPSTWTS
jgi:hypothetical protein